MRKQANDALKPGTAGLFLLIRKMTTDKVLEDLKGVGGTVIKTSFDNAKEEALRAALAAPVPAQPAPPAPAAARSKRRRADLHATARVALRSPSVLQASHFLQRR